MFKIQHAKIDMTLSLARACDCDPPRLVIKARGVQEGCRQGWSVFQWRLVSFVEPEGRAHVHVLHWQLRVPCIWHPRCRKRRHLRILRARQGVQSPPPARAPIRNRMRSRGPREVTAAMALAIYRPCGTRGFRDRELPPPGTPESARGAT